MKNKFGSSQKNGEKKFYNGPHIVIFWPYYISICYLEYIPNFKCHILSLLTFKTHH